MIASAVVAIKINSKFTTFIGVLRSLRNAVIYNCVLSAFQKYHLSYGILVSVSRRYNVS